MSFNTLAEQPEVVIQWQREKIAELEQALQKQDDVAADAWSENERLEAKLVESQQDAERYRWLTHGGWEVMQDPIMWPEGYDFDAAIDAARGEE